MRRITAAINSRVRQSERALIARAAELCECSVSELVRRAAVARARRIIQAAEDASERANGPRTGPAK